MSFSPTQLQRLEHMGLGPVWALRSRSVAEAAEAAGAAQVRL